MALLAKFKLPASLGFVAAVITYSCATTPVRAHNGPSIGIIGSGVGGTSCAYFLRELFGQSSVIDLFERDQVGGRLATVTIDNKEYESGGSIIHGNNAYMVNLTKLMGLQPRANHDGKISFYDGKELVFVGSEWDIVTGLKLFWRYGYDVIRIGKLVKNMLKDFERIYQHQHDGQAFTDVEALLESMSPRFINMTRQKLRSYLLSEGFSERFVDELATAAMRVNYGQTTNTSHTFVGAISLAGIEPGLWAVHGGNKMVPLKLSKHADQVHHAEVTTVTHQKSSSGDVTYRVDFVTATGEKSSAVYDLVVIACPFVKGPNGIAFKNFPEPGVQMEPREYQRTVATFVKGTPNVKKFGYTSIKTFPTDILTTNSDLFFNSIGLHYPVDRVVSDQHLSSIYKVFSHVPLTKEEIDELFISVDEMQVVDWLAYPKYSLPEKLSSFILHNHLYYLNSIEFAASAMEMEVIAAKNVALLAYNQWHGLIDKIDAHIYERQKAKESNVEL